MSYTYVYQSPLGCITLLSDGKNLTGLWFEGQKHYAVPMSGIVENTSLPIFADVCRWLDCYFSGVRPSFMPLLKPCGTPFRLAVWQVLLEIPYGATMSYKSVAAITAGRLGLQHMSAQAVGGAIAHNPISIIIPCHRVLAVNGALTGYAGGLHRKRSLLLIENPGLLLPDAMAR